MAGRAGKARRTTCPWPPADRSCAARSSSEAADIDPLDLASDAVRRAQSEGADAAEAYAITFTSRSVYIEDDVPKVAEERSETGLGVRAAKAKRVAISNGIVANHRGPLVFAYLTAKCGSKGKFGEGILKAMNTSIRPIDFAALGATVARRASENLRARAFKGKLPGVAVLDPLDLGEIFLTTVGSAGNGEDVHKGRSPWAGKVGADVASAGVTVRDRPRMQGGLASGVADDEGNATQDRPLLEAGRLKGFFADRKHAALLGVPAGNGYRRAVATVEGAYTRPAETEPSNLVVEPGRKSLEALLAEVDSGVYVEKFAAPEVNPLSGSFAMEVRNATLIKKGELADHVKVALLTGNFYDGLKNVVGVGRDLAPSHGFLTAPGCSYVPPMAFDGFELVGQA